MKTFFSAILLFFVILFSSCFSSMKVKVDALNMPAFKKTYLYSIESIEKREKDLQYIMSDEFQKQMNDKLEATNDLISNSGIVPVEDTSDYSNENRTLYKNVMPGLVQNAKYLFVDIQALKTNGVTKALQDNYDKNYANLTVSLDAYHQLIKRFNEILESDNVAPEDSDKAIDLSNSISALASNIPTKSTFGETIVSDPMASVIAALPKQYWSKYDKKVNLSTNAGGINQQSLGDINKYVTQKPNRFNNTVARTKIGNSDIAIMMKTPGEFIVKGVRVDADEAVRNSFKVVSQGIKYLAYSAGIPVTEGANTPKKSITPLLDSLSKKENELQSTKERYANLTDAFLAVLINASDDLNATRARRGQTSEQFEQMKEAAVARVKTAYEIYKKALSN
jgi:hypothetical protein